jgi:hypothetical protein
MTIQELKDAIRRTAEYIRLVALWNEASNFVELRRVVLENPDGFDGNMQASVGLVVGHQGAIWYVDFELVTFYRTWWSRCPSERDSLKRIVDEAEFDEVPSFHLNYAASEAFREDTVEAAERVRAEGARLMGDLENRRALVNALLDLVKLSREELSDIINTRAITEVMTS